MKNREIKRLGLSVLAIFVLVGLCGCQKWDRLKTVHSVSIVSVGFSSHFNEFSDEGDLVSDSITPHQKIIPPYKMNRGLSLKKTRLAAQALENQKQYKEVSNEFIIRFKQDVTAHIGLIFTKNDYVINNYNSLHEYIDLDKKNIKDFVSSSGADAVVSFDNNLGVIQIGQQTGVLQEYELVLKLLMSVSDKKGYIGEKEYFIRSGIIRKFGLTTIPTFTEEDYAQLEKKIISVVQADIFEIKHF